jgi:SAM-dependent methyltransferase
MRSRHVDRFNHDTEVEGYDADVTDEANPVRNGYAATLEWVIAAAAVDPTDVVIDLGTGTGNLAMRVGPCSRLLCIDVSTRMLDVAREKLPTDTEYVEDDLLEFAARAPECDAVISTYAIHHLVAAEKAALLTALFGRLRAGGRVAIGDLMVAGADIAGELRAELAHADADEMFDDEFPWYVDDSVAVMERIGFVDVRAEQLGVLSWGLAATKP